MTQMKRLSGIGRLALLASLMVLLVACGRDREEPPAAEPAAAAPVVESAQAAPTATEPPATARRAPATATPTAARAAVTPTPAPATAVPQAEQQAAAAAESAAVPGVTVLPPVERAVPAPPLGVHPLGKVVGKVEAPAEAAAEAPVQAAKSAAAAGPVAAGPVAAGPVLPDRLEISAIHLDVPVVEIGWKRVTDAKGHTYSEWDEAEYAAGWHMNSALPGDGGNVVLSGHNNIAGAVFRELDQLEENDVMTLWTGDERVEYAVDQVLIVPDKFTSQEQRLKNGQYIQQFTDDRLTLVSCWPRNNNTHRIIVIGHRIGGEDQTAAGEARAGVSNTGQ